MSNRRLQGAGGRICSPSANMLMAMADPVLSFCLPLVGPVGSATRLGDSDRHHGRGACRVARRRRQVPPRRKTTFCRFEGAPNASRDDLGFVGPIPGVSPPPTEEPGMDELIGYDESLISVRLALQFRRSLTLSAVAPTMFLNL